MSDIRVLLVDDHAMMRAGFRTILSLQDDIDVVGEAANGAEAVSAASALHPDVICMDVQMPGMDGLEATRRIVSDPSVEAAVLIVTTFDRDDYLFQALSAGASGFLLKNAGPEELVSAVRVVAGGDALLAPEVTRRVIARFARPDAEPAIAAAPPPHPASASLTEREAEVLRLMAEALSNAEIAARLFIGDATVKTHVSNVLQKLGARDRVQAVVIAHRHGLA
ncbi:LuxR family two component transcriptional regulator [Microbacterium sp. AG1240]|uniref:response regulator n=1 Tax=Microbacterium sp. AG1240 TaxID=2183992 RepID=UPI000EAF92DF|nr:response regulator transcription factor [Microbacterium sp. AG1240]RKT31396.1 LuxR family two component transcriptional regulator [Microbacterium sp. AG1240]